MHLETLTPLLLLFTSAVQACPMHGPPDHIRAEQGRIDALLRKRNYVRPSPQRFAITNVHVFDGDHYDNKTSTVVIDGSFIGTDDTNATVIDGNGEFLMPGLFDNHNHVTAVEDLQNLSAYGVTTTMCASCWDSTDLCESFRNQPGLPDFYSSGYSAVVTNSSHSKLAETLPSINAPQYFINNASMCPGWVQDRINTGSDFIKLVAEAYPPTMSQQEHNTIVKATREAGYFSWTHASTLDAYNTSIISTTDFIQHTPADANLTDAMIAEIVANKQYVTPTVNIYQAGPAVKEALQLTDAEFAQLNYTIRSNVQRMYDAGIPILAGTDASVNANGPAVIYFGSSLHLELKLLNSYGMSNLDVLKAATSRAARAYNMLDRGVIAPGLRADLLLLRENPLQDISAIDSVDKVWTAGVLYEG